MFSMLWTCLLYTSITAIYAAFAQKESESISGNMRWSYQRRMEQGAFNTYHAPVGFTCLLYTSFDRDTTDYYVKVDREAAALYLSGTYPNSSTDTAC